ncbi:hypothetical protein Mucpa_2920 [Mucilaginibacter paludis DSM 18603]|uniref:Secreted protein n=1 Tax=Mucilaginibacter paludis DSM 18603 TaxID=714943 RepID=H1YBV0_9SPHI|nr:hypothetical protein Mucpa_2920 [Mucilaginibacter paludis DSM 18603]
MIKSKLLGVISALSLAIGGALAKTNYHFAQVYYYTVASVCTATPLLDKMCPIGGVGCLYETSPGNFHQLYATNSCSPSSSLREDD